ncbi:alpha/beta fold hydrolase [Actinokineospora sp. G85]|uniref:alpha/beta fold hydrolase n=1 Tax=Actinokineospora sp. G85 TaxID=3406626 RepID=UPI003C76873F
MAAKAEGLAVVVGAGMAGLFAARVLLETHTEVVVVERDELPDGPEPRKRVPQGRHVHGLLARGQLAFDALFPGIADEFGEHGCALGDVTGDVRWVFDGARMRQAESDLRVVSASRPMLEWRVRERVRALPGVRFLLGHDLVRPLFTGGAVTGVELSGPDGVVQTLDTALVVDATGRGSRAPVWLAENGYGRVQEETAKIGIGYTTRHYRVPDEAMGGDLSLHIVATPGTPRGAVAAKVDGGRVVVTAYGMNGDHPPTDEEGFLAYLASLSAPDVHRAVLAGEPVDELVTYRFPANLRRRYERLPAFPAGLLVVGDAVCSFNPTYAQGMTVAAIEAQVLAEQLARGPVDARAFFAAVAEQAVDGPWEMALSTDAARSGAVATDEATAAVLAGACEHPEVAVAYARVVSLVDPPSALGAPAVRDLLTPRRVTTGGLTFDVQVSGPEDGTPVVLLHGWPHNYRSWTDVLPALHRAGLRTIAPNQRGYSPGARPDAVEDYRLPLLAGDVLGIMDELGVASAHVVGHDWGAIVAWHLAAKHADRVRTLTATAFPHLDAYQSAYRDDAEQQAASEYVHVLQDPATAEAWLADDAAQLRGLLALHDNALTPQQQARYLDFHTQPGVFAAALKWYRAGTLLDGRSDLGQITIPTTFIWSTDDASVSTAAAERTADYVKAPYRVVELGDGASHWQPQQFPDLVAAEVLALVGADAPVQP